MNSRRRYDDCCNKIIQKYMKQSTEMIEKKYSDGLLANEFPFGDID